MQLIMLNIDCLRIVVVDEYNWEERENIFISNMKKY